jgi:WD40 repeat protein
VLSQGCEHTQGINDLCFTSNENEVVTCSSDRTTRVHAIDFENKALQHKTVLNISDFDADGYKENIEKQQLGLLFSDKDQEIMTVNLHSDINVWSNTDLQEKPNKTIRGHCNAIKAMTIFNGTIPVTGCLDGRLLSWDMQTGLANRAVGHYKHKIGISSMTSNSKWVYSFAGDQTAMVYEMKEVPE